MRNFIDRRLNPKDKSLGNRQRFLKRAREELKRSIKEQVKTGRIADISRGSSSSPANRKVTNALRSACTSVLVVEVAKRPRPHSS